MPAEHNVDQIVFDQYFKNAGKGILVEVGAADPELLSIGASFRDRGWDVIPIEPNPEFCKLYRERGLMVCEAACSDIDSDDASFFVVSSFGHVHHGAQLTFESFSSLGI